MGTGTFLAPKRDETRASPLPVRIRQSGGPQKGGRVGKPAGDEQTLLLLTVLRQGYARRFGTKLRVGLPGWYGFNVQQLAHAFDQLVYLERLVHEVVGSGGFEFADLILLDHP